MCRNCRGEDHFKQGASHLTVEEAKEQLLHDLRDQIGAITFDIEPYDDPDTKRGDGIVIANINGRQGDHYIYHEDDD